MIGKHARWALRTVAMVSAAALGAGITACAGSGQAPSGIAVVNADTGPTGARVVQALQEAGGHEWAAVSADEANTDDYTAVITLPTDLTESMSTLVGDQPKRAEVTVRTHEDADTAVVDSAVDEVTHQIGAIGVDAALTATAQARSQISQVHFTAQLLSAGVNAAAAGADQFSSGADQLLGFLDFAKEGSAQLTSAIALLESTMDGAATQANQLADALDSTGITIGQVEQTASTVSSGLDQILPLLRALPFANDPALADIIGKLEGLHAVAGQAGPQLNDLGELVGAATDPDTDLGTLLRTVVDRLTGASAQLSEAAKLAEGLPQLAEEGGAQLVSAISQLTGGVDQLQRIVGNLNTQTDKAVAAIPQRSSAQQSALALALTDPVDIVRK
ncbi:YhgE/Pip domain-containing protein [Nocardia sp. 004]|uniref:YhgE/Pip domain-containing protein n=1 Tax=Nocardia sp. 004 TaxID=3385978 RepID=UPI00399F65A7